MTLVRFRRSVCCVLCAVCHLLCADAAQGADDLGILILAHGGSARWNHAVEATVAEATLRYPTEIAFGMGMHAREVRAMQQAVARLERKRVSRLIVVPLLVSSASEVMRQFQYLFRLREHGSWEEGIAPLALRVPVVMTAPLDDDPVVTDILLERARQISAVPSQEAVLVVAHGPVSDEDNRQWLEVMQRIAARLEKMGNFRAVLPVTMRDDAPEPVLEAAIAHMRDLVSAHSRQGPVLVVPLLIANGGIERKIPQRLSGLTYTFQERTLLPHPTMSRWIAARVLQAAGPGAIRSGTPEVQEGAGHVRLR